jgi:hypothetical protein
MGCCINADFSSTTPRPLAGEARERVERHKQEFFVDNNFLPIRRSTLSPSPLPQAGEGVWCRALASKHLCKNAFKKWAYRSLRSLFLEFSGFEEYKKTLCSSFN